MDREQKQLIFAGILGVVLIFVVVKQLGPLMGMGGGAAPAPAAAATTPVLTATGTDLSSLLEQPERSDDTGPGDAYTQLVSVLDVRELDFTTADVRNPFRPLLGPGSLAEEERILDEARQVAGMGIAFDDDSDGGLDLDLGYALAGIIWNNGEPVCLMNDQVLAVGDEIEEGGIITAITEEAVVFTYEGTSFTLTFLPEA